MYSEDAFGNVVIAQGGSRVSLEFSGHKVIKHVGLFLGLKKPCLGFRVV